MIVSAKALTQWLRTSGTLSSGRVSDVAVQLEHKTTVSTLAFARVAYSADAPPGLPSNVVVKQSLAAGGSPNVAPAEIDFYRRLAPAAPASPLARCLAAIDGDGKRGPLLVLEDLRATHDHKPWPMPPSEHQAEAAVDALASIHACWWEHAELGRSVGCAHTVESLNAMVAGVASMLPGFLETVGDAIPTASRRLYERVFSSSLAPWIRLADPRALTVTHGDAHPWNFLFPRAGSGPAVLLDWQLWHVDVGARDLAFLIALHWYPDRRRELELPLLHRYHDRLEPARVLGYSFADLLLDYRRSVVRNLTFPVLLWNRGLAPEAWFHRLHCTLAAYRDLGCEELLDAVD